MMCRCAYYKELLIHFLLGIMPLLNVENWPKLNILLKQFVSAIPLKPLNRILWNFVVMKDKLCKCAYLQEIYIYMGFFFGSYMYAPFELRNLTKIKYTTKSVCNRNSSKLSHKISWNLVGDEDILCRCAYSQEILIWFFFLKEKLELWSKCTISCTLCETSVKWMTEKLFNQISFW